MDIDWTQGRIGNDFTVTQHDGKWRLFVVTHHIGTYSVDCSSEAEVAEVYERLAPIVARWKAARAEMVAAEDELREATT